MMNFLNRKFLRKYENILFSGSSDVSSVKKILKMLGIIVKFQEFCKK